MFLFEVTCVCVCTGRRFLTHVRETKSLPALFFSSSHAFKITCAIVVNNCLFSNIYSAYRASPVLKCWLFKLYFWRCLGFNICYGKSIWINTISFHFISFQNHQLSFTLSLHWLKPRSFTCTLLISTLNVILLDVKVNNFVYNLCQDFQIEKTHLLYFML